MNTVPLIIGVVSMQSDLSIEEVGAILSKRFFMNLPFGGKELEIHEEIPAIFLDGRFLGLNVILDGHSGYHEDNCYNLILNSHGLGGTYQINISNYLVNVVKSELSNHEAIRIL